MKTQIYPWLMPVWRELQRRRPALPHALLIQGRAGLGKTVLARLFAQSLLCESADPEGLPCGACHACRWFEQGNHPDYRQVEPEALSEAASGEGEVGSKGSAAPSRQIRIDQIRELQDFLTIGTHRGGFRVVLVRPAEAMNAATANALLKNLEEPPPGTLFLLVSSAPDRLLPTVRSRCQRVPVAIVESPAVVEAVVDWVRRQGVKEPEAALRYAGHAPLAVVEEGTEFGPVRDAVIAAFARRDATAIDLADACQGLPLPTVVGWLQKWVYDLALAKAAAAVRYHVRQESALRAMAGSLVLRALLRFERSLRAARAVSQHPLNPRLFLEDLFLRYVELREAAHE
jgi:DNA polymerase-3 subunit delta'